VCTREAIGASSMLRLICRGCGLGENVADVRFELGRKKQRGESAHAQLLKRKKRRGLPR